MGNLTKLLGMRHIYLVVKLQFKSSLCFDLAVLAECDLYKHEEFLIISNLTTVTAIQNASAEK